MSAAKSGVRRKRRRNAALFSSAREDWCTPDPILEAIRVFGHGYIGLDPCSGPMSRVRALCSYARPQDGLALPWDCLGLVFCNPPFGRRKGSLGVVRWVERASTHGDETILLVPARTEAAWWCDHVWPRHAAICWVRGRVRYHDGITGEIPRGVSSTFPTAIVFFGTPARGRVFRAALEHLGHVTLGPGRLARQATIGNLCPCVHGHPVTVGALCARCWSIIDNRKAAA